MPNEKKNENESNECMEDMHSLLLILSGDVFVVLCTVCTQTAV